MLPVQFSKLNRPLRVLCLGAHSDDIEIGCGGTILRMMTEVPNVEVRWVVLSARGARKQEAVASAKRFLRAAGRKRIVVKQFKESFFPYVGDKIKAFFEQLKVEFDPDLILTHYRHDLHQDHRVVSDFTWNTFRDHLIWEYEIPKYDGDMGVPNVFSPLSRGVCAEKIGLLMEGFGSQRSRRWFTDDTFWAILRLRGVEAGSVSRFAEAFYVRKLILS